MDGILAQRFACTVLNIVSVNLFQQNKQWLIFKAVIEIKKTLHNICFVTYRLKVDPERQHDHTVTLAEHLQS